MEIPPPRAFHSASNTNSFLIIHGGKNVQKKGDKSLSDIWVFWFHRSRESGHWRHLCTSPSPRYGHLSFVINDKVYVFGGSNDNNKIEHDIITFDFKTGLKKPETFKTISSETIFFSEHPEIIYFEPVIHSSCVLHDENLYFFGGTQNVPLLKKEKRITPQIDKKKLILLGMPETGKTAFSKHSIFLYGNKLSFDQKKDSLKAEIYSNIFFILYQIVDIIEEEKIEMEIRWTPFQSYIRKISSNNDFFNSTNLILNSYTSDLSTKIEEFIETSEVQSMIQKHKNRLLQGALYFLKDIRKFRPPSYEIVKEDFIKSVDVTKSGIEMIPLMIDQKEIKIIDASGSKSSQQKWQLFLSNIPCIIYFVNLTHYSQIPKEGVANTRLEEDLELFKELHSSNEVPFILCFNMIDLFGDFIKEYPLKDVKGVEESLSYIITRFKNYITNDRVHIHIISSFNEDHIHQILKCALTLTQNTSSDCICSCGWTEKKYYTFSKNVEFFFE